MNQEKMDEIREIVRRALKDDDAVSLADNIEGDTIGVEFADGTMVMLVVEPS